MIKVKLTNLSITHNNLRTNSITGKTNNLPEEDYPFVMVAEGLEFGTRVVNTSLVVNVEQHDTIYVFTTISGSKYQVEVIDDRESL